MSLSEVLSAIREMVHQDFELPNEFEDRKKIIASRFSNLTTEELEDLAAIEPKKINIYTKTIFGGEKTILSNRFPITFALLKSYWSTLDTTQEKLNELWLVNDLHKKRPWKDNTAIGLASTFVEYIKNDCEDISSALPEIQDLVDLEFSSLRIAREKTRKESACEQISDAKLKTLLELRVSELLALTFSLNTPSSLHKFNFDVITYRSIFFSNKKTLPPNACQARQTYALGSRGRDLKVHWLNLSAAVYKVLNSAANSPQSLSDLAEAFSGELNKQSSEQEIFEEFMKFLCELLKSNALVFTKL